jgi:hypothetical protein
MIDVKRGVLYTINPKGAIPNFNEPLELENPYEDLANRPISLLFGSLFRPR